MSIKFRQHLLKL